MYRLVYMYMYMCWLYTDRQMHKLCKMHDIVCSDKGLPTKDSCILFHYSYKPTLHTLHPIYLVHVPMYIQTCAHIRHVHPLPLPQFIERGCMYVQTCAHIRHVHPLPLPQFVKRDCMYVQTCAHIHHVHPLSLLQIVRGVVCTCQNSSDIRTAAVARIWASTL